MSRILGYVRDAVVAYQHGATGTTDVYFASFTLPDLMSYMLAGGALSITFLPMFSDYLHNDREEEGWQCFSVIATTIGTILIGLIIVGFIAAPWIVRELFPGFSDAKVEMTVRLTRIVLPAQVFFYIGGLMSATILARERFLEAALAPIIYVLCTIAGGVLLGPDIGIEGFSWGALVGAGLGPFGLIGYAARKRGMRFSPRWSLTDPDISRFVKLSLPVMIGFSLVSVDEWISRYFASSMEEGSISWLQNARRLMLVPVSVLGQAAGQATLPFLAKLNAEGKKEEAASLLSDALRAVIFATLASSAWMILTSEPIIGLFYERGMFTRVDTVAVSAALVLFSIGIVFWAIQGLAARGFYALQNTITPMLIASLITVLAVPVYCWLGGAMGHSGLALATTIGMMATGCATLWALHRRIGLKLAEILSSTARSTVVVALAGLLTWIALQWIGESSYLLVLVTSTGVFCATTAVLATVLKVPEWTALLGILKRKLG